MAFHYAQIDPVTGLVNVESWLSSKVEAPNLYAIPNDFDAFHHRMNLESGEWENYDPPEPEPVPEPISDTDMALAQILLNQAEIQAAQEAQDETLAAILLAQVEG